MSDEPPPYDAPAGEPRTFDEGPVPPPRDDEFKERAPDAAPVNEPLEDVDIPGTGEEIPIPGRTEAFRPDVPAVESPAVPMPEIEPTPARPVTPADAPATEPAAEEADEAAQPQAGEAVPGDLPAVSPIGIDARTIAWREAPAPTRSVLTVTYSRPEPVRGAAAVNDGWTPKPRSPQFAKN